MADETKSNDAEAVLRVEREIMSAIEAKNAAALDPMVAEEFTYRTHFGAESNKSEFLQSIAAIPVEIISMRGEELKVNVYGDTAIITGVQLAEARLPEGEMDESAVAFTDVFVRREGQWLLVLAYGVDLPSET
jgi:ketosteroid isomerase-like protein